MTRMRKSGDWTFLGVARPCWERGRPVRNRGRRPLQRPLAAPGRTGRPRSQRLSPGSEASLWTAAGSEGRRSQARRRFGSGAVARKPLPEPLFGNGAKAPPPLCSSGAVQREPGLRIENAPPPDSRRPGNDVNHFTDRSPGGLLPPITLARSSSSAASAFR
jgi:hypothetical protein